MNSQIKTINKSGICLNPTWSHAYEIVRLASKISVCLPMTSFVPSTAVRELGAACERARLVLESQAKRRQRVA